MLKLRCKSAMGPFYYVYVLNILLTVLPKSKHFATKEC